MHKAGEEEGCSSEQWGTELRLLHPIPNCLEGSGGTQQLELQPENAGLLTVTVTELWCRVPLVQYFAENLVFSTCVLP